MEQKTMKITSLSRLFDSGWAKTRVFQEKGMGNWVFGFFLLYLGFSGFFLGFWVFQIPYILGI
jgi:hypothetical protein